MHTSVNMSVLVLYIHYADYLKFSSYICHAFIDLRIINDHFKLHYRMGLTLYLEQNAESKYNYQNSQLYTCK